jgi:hypothetical protein
MQAILTNRNAAKPVETIVLSSTHRLAEKVSEKLHEAYKKARPEVSISRIVVALDVFEDDGGAPRGIKAKGAAGCRIAFDGKLQAR